MADPVVLLLVDWNDRESGGRKDHGCPDTVWCKWKKLINIYKKPCATREEDLILGEASWEQLRLPWLTQSFYY
jgi:hypothetical protein